MIVRPDRSSTTTWRKSRASADQGGCVEISNSESSVLIRDSRNRSGAMLAIPKDQWLDLLKSIKNGDSPQL